MKWKKKGHELDEVAKRLQETVRLDKKLYVFGAGELGLHVQRLLEHLGIFGGYIDNDPEKQKKGMGGRRVLSLETYADYEERAQIIVAADRSNLKSICGQLSDFGLKPGKDYFLYENFMEEIMPVVLAYEKNLSYVNLAQICLTERCSLKCEKCAHGCYNVGSEAEDMPFDMVCQSADSFFEKVELAGEFVLIGGEPLLYGNLTEAIEYIGDRYRKKILTFGITTNGTIKPTEGVLYQCRKHKVEFHISNYSKELPGLKQKHGELTRLLEEKGIEYYLGKPDSEWMDYGFDQVRKEKEKEELRVIFDRCKTPCREIRGNKYYYCVMARSVSDNLGLGIGLNDYLDFNELKGEDYKKILLEYNQGYSEKGYLEMCGRCNGADAWKYPVPAAKQIKKQR